jgi:lysozyme family protein
MSADNFERCFQLLLKDEGGFVNDPKDRGGATNLGVTLGTWSSWVRYPATVEMIKALTPDDVRPLYKKNYWDYVKADQLLASRFAQLAAGVSVDGLIGTITLKQINAMHPDDFVRAFTQERIEYLHRLDTFDRFGRGWLNRISRVQTKSLEMIDEHSLTG